MATYKQTVEAYNKAIAAGLDPNAAAQAAGITDENIDQFSTNDVGTPATNPNYGKLIVDGQNTPADLNREVGTDAPAIPPPPASSIESSPANLATPVAKETNSETVTERTTVTGGATKTTINQPTQYTDTPASTALQAQADDLQAQKTARIAELKAEGATGAQILRDPTVRDLSNKKVQVENEAQQAKEPVPGTGGQTVTVTPNTDANTEVVYEGSPDSQTNNAGGSDPVAQTAEVAQTNALVPQSTVAQTAEEVQQQDNPYPSLSEEEQQEQDNPYGGSDPDAVLTEEEQQAQDNPPDEQLLDDPNVEADAINAENAEAAAFQQATLDKARAQNTIANQRSNKNNADWRVKLRLAPQADYLYAAANPGILKPLKATDGVLFPYTPTIQTTYKANYSQSDITHSNYKGYFYQGSAVEPVTLSCPFTAQNTTDAEYLLAVIHFFKSVTKMFYGQDPQRGAPPPLVYLTGLGQFQFNEHPCVVTSFTYELPADIDYIRAYSPNVNNANMLMQRQGSNGSQIGTQFGGGILGGLLGGAINRLMNAGLPKGGIVSQPAPQTLGTSTDATYVPTKMNISISLLPVVSRKAQSQRFSVRQYANGDLLKGGMW